VTINQPQVEHKVRIKDFENWLDSAGRSPAEMSLKSRLRDICRTLGPAEGMGILERTTALCRSLSRTSITPFGPSTLCFG
jgi:hypothetical protein